MTETSNTTSQLATELDTANAQVTNHQQEIQTLQAQIKEHETGLVTAQSRVKELTKEMCKQLGVPYQPKPKGTGKTRIFDATALQNIREGQKKRWENFHNKKQQQQEQSGAASVANTIQ